MSHQSEASMEEKLFDINDVSNLPFTLRHPLEQAHGAYITGKYGKAMNHMEKHLLINRAFAGKTELTPYINRENNQDLLISMQSAGIYNGKKDKRGEKLAETEEDKLESRTDGSDAFDTLYIGCAKFPQSEFLIKATSGSS